MAEELGWVRQMWHLLEPLHAVVYYAPEAAEELAALGYPVEERWPAYFACRTAPLGPLGPGPITAACYSFAPAMVRRHAAGLWSTADPEAVLAARLRVVDRFYRRLLGDRIAAPELAEAAELAWRAALAADCAGRPLAAANAALPWPDAPHLRLWQAALVLREHRGDGHLAALLVAGLDPVESLVSFAAIGAASERTFASRGWSPAEWDAAGERLTARGLLGPDGSASEAGRALRARVERETNALAAAPWAALGAERTARLADLLGEFWVAVLGSGLLPRENTLGIGRV
ncbi:hypothetical protein FH609_021140 [Streptomyces sp. 3MP-14]|uniref:SalK n=1 Tax=Streptomyces mimosae TaxID=2586635 RepID=A0A5N6A5S6_9ACTN|nr:MULTISPECIES: hypothetical protein [Streptomyces]KAB8163309.1 hypothetical protein FH607_018555 [Streptomyces mimosae]KAB8174586.1 hypothetical protein FH609_021140 [Streptomyces sp. 3MP-14]